MSRDVLFQMWEPFRQSLIAGHLFYVEQARKRLLSQFDDIDAEADRAAADWLQNNSHRFDPDRHDPGDFEERAYEAAIEFHGLMTDLREQTHLSVVAGMFHEWEKQLRNWLVREIQHWHRGDNVKQAVWKKNLGHIFDLLEGLGWEARSTTYFPVLDACRLVVNVYKHGEGDSLVELKQKYPEYLDDSLRQVGELSVGADYLDHTHLKVTDEQIQAFSDAIVAFWKGVPENIFNEESITIPDWFELAMNRDVKAAELSARSAAP